MDDGKHALVVGINDYSRGVPELHSAVNDARTVAAKLESAHDYDVTLLIDADATVANIVASLADLVDGGLSEDSSFILYYAGHGVATDDREGTGPQGYLLAHDADLTNLDTWLEMSALRAELDRLTCRHLMLVLDCCYAGAFRWASTRAIGEVQRPLFKSQYERYREGVAWQVLTSASFDEKADDIAAVTSDRGESVGPDGHSPFAQAFIAGLDGDSSDTSIGSMASDGVITATELYQFIYSKVATNDRQTPGIFPLRRDNSGEFVFMAPGAELKLEPDPPLDDWNNPWPGLDAYTMDDRDLFFGRDEVVADLCRHVETRRFVALVGASGSGTSSLIQAGLLPALEEAAWTVVQLAGSAVDMNEWLDAARHQLSTAEPNDRRLLVIDRFDELFAPPASWSDASGLERTACVENRRRFLDDVRSLVESDDGPTVLVAVRSDFDEGGVAELEQLWTHASWVPVPEFDSDDLRAVILDPAAAKAVFFEPVTLVDDLIDEVRRMPGAAPLLSATLAELYRRAQVRRRTSGSADRMLSADDHAAVGGVVGTLVRRADGVYAGADADGREAMRRILLRLVSQQSDGLKRRRIDRSELGFGAEHEDLVNRTLQRLVGARLLVLGGEGDLRYVEPAHDALVSVWDRQLEWLARSGSQNVIRDAWTAAESWRTEDHRGAKSKYLWTYDPRLVELEQRDADGELNALEHDFLVNSTARKATVDRLRRIAIAGLVVLTIVASSAFVVALISRNRAQQAEAAAVTEAKIATARQIAAQAQAEAPDEPDLSWLLAVAAHDIGDELVADGDIDEPLVEPSAALLATLEATPELVGYLPVDDAATALAASPGSPILATGDASGVVTIWDTATLEDIDHVELPDHPVSAIAVSRDASFVAIGDSNGDLTLWDRASGSQVDVAGDGSPVTRIAVAADAAHVAVAAQGPRSDVVAIHDAVTGERVGSPLTDLIAVRSMAFDGSGNLTVIGWSEQYDCAVGGDCLATGINPEYLPLMRPGPSAFNIAANLGATSQLTGGTVSYGALDGPKDSDIELDAGFLEGLAFSPDGTVLVAIQESELSFWDTSTAEEISRPLPGVAAGINAVIAFPSADASQVATLAGGRVQLWERDRQTRLGAALQVESVSYPSVAEGVVAAAVSPLGERVAWLVDLPGGFNRTADSRIEQEGESIAVLDTSSGEVTTLAPDESLFDLSNSENLFTFRGADRLVTNTGDVLDVTDGERIADARVECVEFDAILSTDSGGLDRCEGGLRVPVELDSFGGSIDGLDLTVATVSDDGTRLAVFDPTSMEATIHAADAPPLVIDLSTDRAALEGVAQGEGRPLLELSPNGDLLVVASWRGGAYSFWNTDDGSLVLSQSRGRVRDIAFGSGGGLVAFDLPDGGVEIRNSPGLGIVTVLAGDGGTAARSLVFPPDRSVLVEVGVGGGLTLWDLDPDSWARQACDAAGRTLTGAELNRFISDVADVNPCA